jgi:hypothetical protein
MSNFKIYSSIVAAAVVAGTAYAAPARVGGGGGVPHAVGGGGGVHIGGGAPHFGGGGAPHFAGGGGAPHFGGAHIGAAPHFGGAHIGRAPAISHFAARPSFHSQPSFAVRGAPNRTASGAANLNPNRAPTLNGNRAASLGQGRNAALTQNPSATARSNAVRKVLNSPSVAGALHNRAALLNPNARAQIVAAAATAGWHDRRGEEHGWWRHRHGGFGWVGPIFWPFAYYDIYDYALGGYDYDPLFWDYGYNDIYAGLFAPYGYGDVLAYLPPSGGGSQVTVGRAGGASRAPNAVADQLAEMCGDDSREIAGLPIDRIQQAIQPNDAQRAALDDLANASIKAAQQIKAACPAQIALTAPGRLAAMQQRIEAMISAVETVQPALQKFWDLVNDEQRARLNAIAQDQRQNERTKDGNRSLVESCQAAQASVPQWPEAEIEARLHLNEAQRTSLAALKDATAKAADMLKASCPTTEPITPPARLEAITNRLETMQQAVKIVRAALDDFYGKLDDEQKAQFEAIGPAHLASSTQPTDTPSQSVTSEQPPATRAHGRHYHHVGIPGIIRHLMSMARW